MGTIWTKYFNNSLNFTQLFDVLTQKLYNLNFLKLSKHFILCKSKTCNSRLKRCAKMLEKIHTSVNLLNKCHNCSQVFHLVTMNCICIAHCILESNISGSFSIFLIIKRYFRAFKMVTYSGWAIYSRVRNKCRALLIMFWTFREGNAYWFFGFRMYILGATFILFAKCTRGYIYSRGYVYSSL